MKKLILTVVAITIMSVGAFANGNQETQGPNLDRSELWEQRVKAFDNAQSVTMEGTLAFDRTRVLLKSDGKTYGLNIPGARQYIGDMDLREGTNLTVTGTLVDINGNYDGDIFTQTVELEGKVYVLNNGNKGFGRGRRSNYGGPMSQGYGMGIGGPCYQ
ncbi:hypothetical protein [Spirochaeta cellobiosiphila]|uniref:hypothetical protein n=1 Tax=Spirochaeta cellobiosiphila TaxID=504483 RepID=UPI0004028DAF|nr:hypothetical protein [Spirochaeta cellobiosiphila]